MGDVGQRVGFGRMTVKNIALGIFVGIALLTFILYIYEDAEMIESGEVLTIVTARYNLSSVETESIEMSGRVQISQHLNIGHDHPNISEHITIVDTIDPELYSLDYSRSHPYENQCRFPILNKDEPDLRKEVEHFVEPECPPSEYPILVEQFPSGELLVGRRYMSNVTKRFRCYARELTGGLRPHRRHLTAIGEKIRLPRNERVFVNKDQFYVRCKDRRGRKVFEDAFTNVPRKARLNPPPMEGTVNISVSILVLDSTSRNQFFRHAPRLLNFMKDEGFHILHGYNKVADNSVVNVLPLLSGMQVDLPLNDREGLLNPEQNLTSDMIRDGLLKHSNMIFQQMQERGCATMMSDDIYGYKLGVFNYHYFNGVFRPMADYFYRPYNLYVYRNQKIDEGCTMGRLYNRRMLNSFEQFATVYKNECHFGFTFLTQLTHDNSNNLELLDESIYSALLRMKQNGVFEHTALIIMGDHGQRVAEIQKTYSGRIEERMPLFAIHLPKKFEEVFPNHNRLVSNFDLHETIRELLFLTSTDRRAVGRSLFHEIPKERDCHDAKIPKQHCMCQLPMNPALVTHEAKAKIFAQFSEFTASKLSALKCVDRVEFFPPTHFHPFTINEMARSGARDPDMWEQILRNGTNRLEESNEIFDVEFETDVLVKPKNADTLQTVRIKSRAVWNRVEDYVRIAAEPMILAGPNDCGRKGIRLLEQMCSCFDEM